MCRADNLPYSCADCLEIWEPHPPGKLRSCPGLYRDGFVFTFYYFNLLLFFLEFLQAFSNFTLPPPSVISSYEVVTGTNRSKTAQRKYIFGTADINGSPCYQRADQRRNHLAA